jgi:hypothetical protein
MRQLLHAAGVSQLGAATTSMPPAILALDAEWQPERKQCSADASPAHPVSILQLATRQHTMVLDLLTLCRPRPASAHCAELTDTEAAVSELLQPLLAGASLLRCAHQWPYMRSSLV